MNYTKLLIFILMIALEIGGWYFIGHKAAEYMPPTLEEQTFSDSCSCCDTLAAVVIDQSALPDYQKAYYHRAYFNLSSYDRKIIESKVQDASITVSKEDAIRIKGNRITCICLGISFLILAFIIVLISQLDMHIYLAPALSWPIIGVFALLYYFTFGIRDRKIEKLKDFHEHISKVSAKFKTFNRMA